MFPGFYNVMNAKTAMNALGAKESIPHYLLVEIYSL
jgi:hypothetical protein